MGRREASANREDGKGRGQQGNGTTAQHDSSHQVWNIPKFLEGMGVGEGVSPRGKLQGFPLIKGVSL